jgi:oligopeptide/dipeptide ABC transporter ATP-binding protein
LLLEIKNLQTYFKGSRGTVKAVDGISFSLEQGEIMGLVGESGCGKSMTLLSLLRLVPTPGKIVGGKILFQGKNLLKKSTREMTSMRGRELAMIFQDPMTSLNPVFKVGEQIRESLHIHGYYKNNRKVGRKRLKAEKERVIELMEEVGIPSPMDRYYDYPHQFSGGMQQRAVIAIALSCEPKLLLADEPTTALDVTIQAQILSVMDRINRDHGMAIILVTHDLGVAAEFCQRIAVMYAGQIVEQGLTDEIMEHPLHPYTCGLLRSIPRIVPDKPRLQPIHGTVPSLLNLPPGCSFMPRCEDAVEECRLPQEMRILESGRMVRCIKYDNAKQGGVCDD